MVHMGAHVFHSASELGAGGAIGIGVGIFLGFPRMSYPPGQIVPVPVYHNAFGHSSDLQAVVVAGVIGGGFVALAVGLVLAGLFGLFALFNEARTKKQGSQTP